MRPVLAKQPFALVLCSPMQRARETCDETALSWLAFRDGWWQCYANLFAITLGSTMFLRSTLDLPFSVRRSTPWKAVIASSPGSDSRREDLGLPNSGLQQIFECR